MIPLLLQLGNYAENGTKSPISGTEVADLVDYADFLELLPGTDAPAISEPNSSRKILSHQHLKEFISCKFDLSKFNIAEHERIAVILPNGPELAVVLLSLLKKWCVAPINPNNTLQEIRHEVQSAKCSQMLIFSDSSLKQSIIQVADELRIGVLGIIPSPTYTGLFSLELLRKGLSGDTDLVPKFVQNPFLSSTSESAKKKSHDEIALLLHTSGTSGNKKLVPYSLDMIIIGVACIICSWNLKPSDVCLNMMPLFHVGGISRNILSPILSGGCVITCSGFDPLLFWDILYSQQINTDMPKATWYYAAPTMHQAILSEAKERPMPLPVDSVRFIANAAGGLLPVLAKALKDTFRATILTSYGMTECMPISTPPQNYDLHPSGTSGTAVGPDILIVDESYHSLPCNQTGNIMIRGPPCFLGYEQQPPVKENDSPSLSQESFFEIEGHGRGWFNTGDMGYLNEEGYLFISGRSKEVINRNGETISPFEIEEALLQHPKIKEVMVFSIPDEKFQENIGALLVMKPNQPRIDLSSLHKYLDEYLQRSKWPQILIYSTGLPKNIAGKLLRVKYAERIGLKLSLDFHSKGESHSRNYYYEAECPAIGTTLTQSISCRPIELNFNLIIHFLFQQEIVKDVTLIFISKDSIQEETYYNQSSCFNKIPIVFIVFNYEKILHLKKFENQFLQELQQLCYHSIDHFLIPFRFYCISSFPRPKNNEDLIDEEKLQQLALQFIQKEHQVNLPKTNLEKEIEMLWKQQIIDPSSTSSISLPLFSIKASFFELGGDSLSAGKIVNAMKRHFQVSLTISDLLNASTIEEMAKKIDSLLLMKSQKMGGKENLLYNSFNNHTRSTCSMSNSTDDHDHQEKLTGTSSVRFLTNENKASFPSYQFLTTPSTDEQDHLENIIHTGQFTSGDTQEATNSTEKLDPMSFAATNRWVLFIQSLPITFLVPLRRAIIWFVMITIWIEFMASTSFQLERFYSLLFAILLTRIAVMLIGPLFAILMKWLIIGKYHEGKNYPIWGSMYLKWWIVEQILEIMGKGIFQYHSKLLLIYYRLLGMNISVRSNIKISNSCKFGSVVDLIEIQDNVLIENSTIIRPFVINQHGKTFSLKSIVIEKNCSIGMKSVIAAGSVIPANTHIGPLSSSHEYDDTSNSSVKNLKYCQLAFPSPPFLWKACLGYPILLIVLIVTYLPWYFILRAMVIDAHESGWYNQSIISIYDAIIWWITPKRIFYFYLLRMTRHCVVPFIRLFMTILIKWLIIGKFKEIFNEEERSLPWNCFQSWLMSHLLSPGEGPDGGLCGVAGLIGTHYETISIIYRLLGAKIGKRIYWPGSGLSNVIEFDLLTIEDDVVFGSRSIFLFSTTTQRKSIVIKKGAMIADRCVILPGVVIGRTAMIGTGSLICEDMKIERETTWIGSQNGQPLNFSSPSTRIKSKNHSAEQFESKDIEDPRGFPHTDNCEDNDDDDHDLRDEEFDQGEFPSPSSTVTPFGKAFYRREANYFVIPLWGVVLYNFLWHAICTCYRNSPLMASLVCCYYFLENYPQDTYYGSNNRKDHDGSTYFIHSLELFAIFSVFYFLIQFLFMMNALLVDIASKWILLGHRQKGSYPWNTSSYCQRWQIYLTIQEIRRNGCGGDFGNNGILNCLQGTGWLIYYYRALGCHFLIDDDNDNDNSGGYYHCCLFPNGGDPMFTEPDLLKIDDYVCIDEASVIGHLNTKGQFSLNEIVMGKGCVLRPMSRLLSGGSMEDSSMLLEHTLVLTGEKVEKNYIWQGWPCHSQQLT